MGGQAPAPLPSQVTPKYQAGFSPAQVRKAYGFDQVAGTGAGQTIAIVDAYGSPSIQKDPGVFDSQFGLPAANLVIAYPQGKPTKNGGWALETSLDVEWAHSIAPPRRHHPAGCGQDCVHIESAGRG